MQIIRLEQFCSGRSIERRLKKEGYIPQSSILHGKKNVTCEELAEAVRKNDEFAAGELDKIAYTFSIGLANMLAFYGVDTIVIGGGVAKMGDILFERIRKYTAKLVFIANEQEYEIKQSTLLDDAVLCGAIYAVAKLY